MLDFFHASLARRLQGIDAALSTIFRFPSLSVWRHTIYSTHTVLTTDQLYRIIMVEDGKGDLSPMKTLFKVVRFKSHRSCRQWPPTERRFKSTVRTSFQLAETDDIDLDGFDTTAEAVAIRNEKDLVKIDSSFLSFIVIVVCHLPFALATHYTRSLTRRFYFSPSVDSLSVWRPVSATVRTSKLQPSRSIPPSTEAKPHRSAGPGSSS